jgi:hypothetical protein
MEKNKTNIDRRDVLKSLSLITGYALTAGAASAFLAGCKSDTKEVAAGTTSTGTKSVLSSDQIKLVAEVAERIIPKTDTPGAKDAGVEQYIANAITGFYKPDDQKYLLEGLTQFDKIANNKYKKNFVELTNENKDDILRMMANDWKKEDEIKKHKIEALRKEFGAATEIPNELKRNHIFKEIRDLTVTGYCTSEIGATKLLVYDPIPGPYKADIPRSSVKGVYAIN